MKKTLALALAISLLALPAAAQSRGQRQGGQSRPAASAPQRQPPQTYSRAVPRPAPPAYRHNHYDNRYNNHVYYGRPYPRAYGYPPRAYFYPRYPYYPYGSIYYGNSGWGVGVAGGYGSVYVERQTIVQPEVVVQPEIGQVFVLFEGASLDASVYVDGNYQGVVEHFTSRPLVVPPGAHVIELRLNGQAHTYPINAQNGQTLRIRAVF